MKKLLLFIVLICMNSSLFAVENSNSNHYWSLIEKNNNQAQLIINGQIGLLEKNIDYLSLARLDKDDLNILRNTIFAKYGYKFRSKKLSDHFSKYKWYKPNFTNVDMYLNDSDKIKIDRIKKYEEMDKKIGDLVDESDISGVWQDMPVMAAGWSRRFVFYHDNKFIFVYSQMRELPEILSMSGTYEINGNCLTVKIAKKVFIEHSDEIETSGAFGDQWAKWKSSKVKLNNFETYNFPITSLQKSESGIPYFSIGNMPYNFYKMESHWTQGVSKWEVGEE